MRAARRELLQRSKLLIGKSGEHVDLHASRSS
jgi:hypothetical protein